MSKFSINNSLCNYKVLPPDVLTRISSYVEEVVVFTEKIIANGYA